MIRIHTHPLSTYSRRVQIALLEKDIPHENIGVDMAAGAHRAPDYLKLNPYGRVPTLQEDAFVLYESTAILNYLESVYPDPPLVPSDARGKARVDMHIKLCDVQMSRQTGIIVFPKRFLPKARWNEADMSKARGEIEKHLDILERILGGGEYLAADRFTLADLCYIPFLEFLPLMEISPPPGIGAWAQRLLARPTSLATKPAV